jgi:hypothetical protein
MRRRRSPARSRPAAQRRPRLAACPPTASPCAAPLGPGTAGTPRMSPRATATPSRMGTGTRLHPPPDRGDPDLRQAAPPRGGLRCRGGGGAGWHLATCTATSSIVAAGAARSPSLTAATTPCGSPSSILDWIGEQLNGDFSWSGCGGFFFRGDGDCVDQIERDWVRVVPRHETEMALLYPRRKRNLDACGKAVYHLRPRASFASGNARPIGGLTA